MTPLDHADVQMWQQKVADARRDPNRSVLESILASATDPATPLAAIGALLGYPVLSAEALIQRSPRFTALPYPEAAARRCALFEPVPPVSRPTAVIVDPFDTDVLAWLMTRVGAVDVALASSDAFDAWLAHAESTLTALDSFVPASGQADGASSERAEGQLRLRDIGASDSPVVQLVSSTLYDALKIGASDIHLETDARGLTVKFRLDGVLTSIRRAEGQDMASQCVSRVKVLSQLDIAETRVPQDGRLQIGYDGREIDLRVSVMPSLYGEDVVLRILDRRHLAESLAGLTLAKLGFDDEHADSIRRLCRRPHGMLLVTGPTGSGKTTTLYAAISETHESRDKIVTIEDPVEYHLPGVLQIPVNERKGLSFARGLRSILRHDPDKILVGEIRDAETAQIAAQSALTGHLVFTTVHANTVFDAVSRFEQFGIQPYTFASAVNGVLAQRLVRKVCQACARPLPAEQAVASLPDLAALSADTLGAARFVQAHGCEACRGTGYRGRLAISELLLLTPTLKGLVSAQAPLPEIEAAAVRGGWRPLRDSALRAVVAGITTSSEIERVAP